MDQTLFRRSLMQGIAAGTVATSFGSRALARQATPATGGNGASDFDVIVQAAATSIFDHLGTSRKASPSA